MGGCQSKWKSVQDKMGEWRTQLKSKIVDLLHCDGVPVSEVSEEDKAVSASASAYGFGLLLAPLGALFLFQPEKLLDQKDQKLLDQHSSKWTLMKFAHKGSIVACYITLVFGLALLSYHAQYTGPSPKATKNKKWIFNKGIFWLAIALFSRAFLALPDTYPAPVAVAVLIGTAGTVLFGYVCSWLSESRDKTQANSNGRV